MIHLVEYSVVPIVVILLLTIYFRLRKIINNHATKYIKHFNAVYLLTVTLIALFWIGSNGMSWRINTEVWSHFGSFIGAFLLAATLLFQIRSFRRQQIEAKFYEMVKYYRENISEMRYRNPFYYEKDGRKVDEEYVTGRRVIKTIFEQYKVALKHVDEQLFSNSQVISNCNFTYPNENYPSVDNPEVNLINKEKWNKFHIHSNLAYLITFWGTPHDITKELDNRLSDAANEWIESDSSIIKNIIESARKLIAVYECNDDPANYSGSLKNKKRTIIKCGENSGKLKFFGGHQYHLAHYFRHFYRSVKYIDNQPLWLMSEHEKKEYIGLLRAQMSNYEQALLFINSISSLGENWEYSGDVDLISKYDLIRNLPEYFIPLPKEKDEEEFLKPQFFYPEVNFEWNNNESVKKK